MFNIFYYFKKDKMNFNNFDLLSVTINNIICSDVVGNYNLTYELIKSENFTRLIKFKVGEE